MQTIISNEKESLLRKNVIALFLFVSHVFDL